MPLGSSLGTARSPWRFWWCWAAPCSSAAAAARAQAKEKSAFMRVRLPAEGDVAGGHRPLTGADAAVAGTACAPHAVAAWPMRTMCCGSRSTVVSTVLNRTCSCYVRFAASRVVVNSLILTTTGAYRGGAVVAGFRPDYTFLKHATRLSHPGHRDPQATHVPRHFVLTSRQLRGRVLRDESGSGRSWGWGRALLPRYEINAHILASPRRTGSLAEKHPLIAARLEPGRDV